MIIANYLLIVQLLLPVVIFYAVVKMRRMSKLHETMVKGQIALQKLAAQRVEKADQEENEREAYKFMSDIRPAYCGIYQTMLNGQKRGNAAFWDGAKWLSTDRKAAMPIQPVYWRSFK